MARKNDIIEDLGNAMIDENAKIYERDYRKQLNALQSSAIISTASGNTPTIKGLRKGFRVVGINRATRNAWIIGNVTLLVNNPRMQGLSEIKAFMKLYSVNNPKLFAFKIDKLVQRSLGAKIKLNPRELRAFRLLDPLMRQNKVAIQKLVNTNTKALKQINKVITTNESRTIIKARRRLINERVTVNGVTRPRTSEEVAKALKGEFRDDSFRVKRILETESHRQNELTKEVTAKAQGFKWKIWNTQRDSKVRPTHAKIDKKRIRINKMFKVGKGRGSQPGASTLPPEENIFCRCFLTFEF